MCCVDPVVCITGLLTVQRFLIICLYMCRGVLPFSERKLAMMQAQDSSKSLVSATSAVGAKQEPIAVGSVVCMRSKPIYCIGTKAIHIKGGILQVCT